MKKLINILTVPPLAHSVKKSDHPIFARKQASPRIREIVGASRDGEVTCDVCGRVHYNQSGRGVVKTRFRNLKSKHRRDPEKYLRHNGLIAHGEIHGMQIVCGCPCNFLAAFEEFIWAHRQMIANYFLWKGMTEEYPPGRKRRRTKPRPR